LELVTFLLPEACLEGLNELIGKGIYSSRSAAIRFAVLDLLKGELWQKERKTLKEEVVMTRQ
jgi:Arc/MetJ-type ribon-helix-helix transcriptional regulator